MPQRVVSLESQGSDTAQTIREAFAVLRSEMKIPSTFPPEVEAEADVIVTRVTGAGPRQVWPDHSTEFLNIDFITIDPEGSMDLDQAVHLSTDGDGYVVHYAIADVAAFVEPGGAIDAEARVRGTTLYAPDGRTPLHPPALSEGSASLLPNVERPAAVWTIGLEANGKIRSIDVSRGLVRSRARFSYVRAQEILDDLVAQGVLADGALVGALVGLTVGDPEEAVGLSTIALLGVIGPLRLTRERERGGVSLNVPEQEVELTESGEFELSFRVVLPVEDYNAQISLLTGISAAQLMLKGKIGVLRTLPPADPRDLKRLRRTAHALKLNWPKAVSYGEFLDTLDSANPRHAAFQHEATTLFRGADYLAFADASVAPELVEHEQPQAPGAQKISASVSAEIQGGAAASTNSGNNGKKARRLGTLAEAESDEGKHNAIGAHYAHVTAPLRRLGDRFTTEICLAVSAGTEVPQWVREALPTLPSLLNESSRRGNSYGRATTDIVEAAILLHDIGKEFEGVIVEADDRNASKGDVMVSEPAVHGQVSASEALPLGEEVVVRLVEADLTKRRIKFELVRVIPTQGAKSPDENSAPTQAG